MKRISSPVLLALCSTWLAGTAPAFAQAPFAEVTATLARWDAATGTATYRVDSLFGIAGERRARVERVLAVGCQIVGSRPWSFRLERDSTRLAFAMTLTGASWLEVPADGWRMGCRCRGEARVREVAMHGMFVTPAGLVARLPVKRPGFVPRTFGAKPRPPATVRIRLGWTRGLLEAAALRDGAAPEVRG
jgi:hypothetical protein